MSKSKKRPFTRDVKSFMYGFGDVPNPAQDSAELIEDLLLEYINELCTAAVRSSQTSKVQTRDFLHALRKDPKKYGRARELIALDKQLSDARKAFNVDEVSVAENVDQSVVSGSNAVQSVHNSGGGFMPPPMNQQQNRPRPVPFYPQFPPYGGGGGVIHLPGGQVAK
ncbi:Transcription initiation factor TFIID subunit 13 [Nowakowskiella sp. JEL0407]|nr:Transcription initiation factor TFIID subunit 13 [Nowakowskiella sp. JEL0407]